jgi:hypothetical protein
LSQPHMLDRLRLLLLMGVVSFSALTVYTQYVFLQTTDQITSRSFRDTSLDEYHQILDGRRPFPYQWRVAGPWLVRLGEVATGRDPHQIDVLVKVVALAASTLLLIAFTATLTTPLASITAGAISLVLTAAAYSSEGYSIYYTNDFIMVMGWYAAVYLASRGRYGWVATMTFLTAWVKETIILAPILVGLAWWQGRASARDWLLCTVAFLIPTAILRAHYPAPLQYWAWWGNVTLNIPFLRPGRSFALQAARSNLKVLLLFNVLLLLAYRTIARTSEQFVRDLLYVSLFYAAALYIVVNIRELRHFLPLGIMIVPFAVAEIERMVGKRAVDVVQ